MASGFLMRNSTLDWDDLRFFLAIARHGTLAGAAKHLQVTQSTVGRRLASLQEGMGARLLHRTAAGYVLTPAGETIRSHVERVEAETLSVERAISGQDIRLEGVVRVASSQLLTSHLLAPCFAALHEEHAGIVIEAIPDAPDASSRPDLDDADIALRLRQFERADLVVRNIGVIQFGLYACVAYLAKHGLPDIAAGCPGHRLITLLDDGELSTQAAWLTEHAFRGTVVLRADSYETQHWSAGNNGGLAVLPRFRADVDQALTRVPVPVPIPSTDVWIAVHRQNRYVPRIRAVLARIIHHG